VRLQRQPQRTQLQTHSHHTQRRRSLQPLQNRPHLISPPTRRRNLIAKRHHDHTETGNPLSSRHRQCACARATRAANSCADSGSRPCCARYAAIFAASSFANTLPTRSASAYLSRSAFCFALKAACRSAFDRAKVTNLLLRGNGTQSHDSTSRETIPRHSKKRLTGRPRAFSSLAT